MLFKKDNAAIGIGTLILFIAMILVAGMAASVLIETMNSLEQAALKSGQETLKDISSGLKVTHISGFNNGTVIAGFVMIEPQNPPSIAGYSYRPE